MVRNRSAFRASLLTALASVIGGVIGGAVALGPASAGQAAQVDQVVHPEWGHVTGHNGVLKNGCHTYSYSYDITPPEGTWSIEVFVIGPGHVAEANGAFLDGYDPQKGVGHYILCHPATNAGRFTIKTKLSVQDGPSSYIEGYLPPAHFHLHAPHRRHR